MIIIPFQMSGSRVEKKHFESDTFENVVEKVFTVTKRKSFVCRMLT